MRIYIYTLLNILFINTAFSQNEAELLNKELLHFKNDSVLKHAAWGFIIKNTVTDEIIAQYNQEQSLIPASTLKVITTSSALELLGSDYRYQTILKYSGNLQNDTLNGNVYIIGSGDPTPDSQYFFKDSSKSVINRWTNALNKKGIHRLKGGVIAFDDCFDDAVTPSNWLWTDMGNYYGAGPSGLNFMDNKFSIFFKTGNKINMPAEITGIYPNVKNVDLINEVTSAASGSGDNAYVYGSEFNPQRIIRGTLPVKKEAFEIEATMPDAAYFCAQSLHSKINNDTKTYMGISFTSRMYRFAKLEISVPDSAITVDTLFSPRLSEIVHYTNFKSNNLYAESLLKTLSLKKFGKGTTQQGIEMIYQFWKPKADCSGLKMFDGSGLSPMNRITTAMQCDVMVYITKQKYFETMLNSFPVAGKTGSLANICKNTPAEGKIFAKSGYIEGVRAYTGYVKNKKGQWLAFSFIVNNYNCSPFEIKKKMEKVFIAMAQL